MATTAPAPADPLHRDPPLRRNRDFAALLASQVVSAGGDAVSATALPLLVLALTGSGVAMGAVGAITTGADFALAAVAGVLADRGDRKRMMILADLGRAILTALVPLSVLAGGPTMAVIILVAGPMAVLRAFFRAGYLAAMPGLAGRSQLARANGVMETAASAAFILGPAIAGFLVTVVGPGVTLAIDAASFGVSALGMALIRRDLAAPRERPPSRVVDDVREGVRFVVGHRVLRTMVMLFASASAMLAPIGAAMTFRVVRDLGAGPAAFGLSLTALGVGTIAGSLLATRLGPRTNVARVLLASILVSGLSIALAGLVPTFPAVVALNAVSGASEAVLVVVYVSVRAAYSPDALLGRIASTARMLSLALQPVGSLVGGLLIDAVGGGTTLVVIGAAMGALAVPFAPVAALRAATLTGSTAVGPAAAGEATSSG